MDLEQHAHIGQAGGDQRRAHADHRALDDIGARALDRRVDRGTLAALALGLVFGGDAREPALAAEQRFGVALLADGLQGFVDITLDAREALEVSVDHRLRFLGRHAQTPGEAPARDAVENREVDRLGAATGVAVDLAEQFLRGAGVDVGALLERLAQRRHIGHMRRQPQLDLRIVGREQHMAGFRHEAFADLATDLGADRDVLEVRLGRGQAPGLRADQRVGGVHAAGGGVDRRLQRLGVGRAQLGQLPPIEHPRGQLHALAGEGFQHRLVGGILAALALLAALQAHLLEQHLAQLLGAADSEWRAGEGENLRLQSRDLHRELRRQPGQLLAIDADAVAFHPGDHLDQRAVDALINPRRVFIGQPGAQHLPQPPGHLGILGGIGGGAVQRRLGEGDRGFARAADLLEGDAHMPQMPLRQRIHAMPADAVLGAAGIEIEAEHQRIVHRPNRHAAKRRIGARQHVEVILGVLPDLQHRIALEQRFQHAQGIGQRDLLRLVAEHVGAAMAQRDVARRARAGGEADPHQIGGDGIQSAGLGVEGHDARRQSARHPALQRLDRLHAFIERAVDRREHWRHAALRRRGRGHAGRHRLGGVELGRSLGAALAALQPPQQAGEAMRGEECRQGLGRNRAQREIGQRQRQLAILLQRHQPARQPRHVGLGDQAFAQLACLHPRRGGQGAFQ